MEADEAIEVLPRRNSQYKSKFKSAQPCNFFTNLYEIELKQKENVVYQFVVETTPEIPQDSTGLYKAIYRSINKQLKEKIKDVISSGTMIWGFQNLTKAAIFQSEFNLDGENHKYDVMVKPVK
jgi:hypothetical protein